jgi:PAS domain S-box-containing protein
VGWVLRDMPFAHAVFGNACLLIAAALVPAVILRRRRTWSGCQRLFWDVIAIAMTFWIVGHLGWAYDQLVRQETAWLRWHTLFSLSAGFGVLIALLARPHLGPRVSNVGPVAMTIGAYCLLAVFIYSYFVLLPGLLIEGQPATQGRLLNLVNANRLLLLVSVVATFWFARHTAWRTTYLRLSIGVGIGLIFRLVTSQAIMRGDYQVGTVHDLAWILPWLCYAWAAAEAPSTPPAVEPMEDTHEFSSVGLLAVPALLIPLIGYGVLNIGPVGDHVDSVRLFLTSLTTVGALGLVTLRLVGQGTELQRADAQLQLLAAATEHTGDLILITKPDGMFEHANAAFLRSLGYSRSELAALNFTDLIEQGKDQVRRDIAANVSANGVWRGTLHSLRKDGTTFPAACTITALRDPSGRFTHFVAVERDISDDLRLRDQLVHSERLTAIGELIAGVAHEINNPLQTIIGCTELMLDDAGASNRADLELVRKEAMRAGQIVRNLLAFARRGAPDRVAVDLNDLARATAELREYHLQQSNINLTLRCAPHPLPVLVNREEIRQVILNLLLNAEHAVGSTESGGSITISTFSLGGLHVVEVSDSGPGISPELRGKIFEPFFTTREVGEGTGLGLSISHGIASSHGGSLALVDSPVGARFRLSLPAFADVSVAPPDARRAAPPLALVVDDDDAIRKLITKLLERRGFEVSEAQTGDRALALGLERRPGIVICDVSVPGLNGIELHRRLALDGPPNPPPFVFISDDKTASAALEVQRIGAPILAKPFTASDLETALVEVGVAAPRAI